jgi:hypothetical protein
MANVFLYPSLAWIPLAIKPYSELNKPSRRLQSVDKLDAALAVRKNRALPEVL